MAHHLQHNDDVSQLLMPVASSLHAVFIAAALIAWLALLAAWLIPAGAGLRERIEVVDEKK